MDLGLAERVYLVTGGTQGLGRATAECLVAEGARVVVSSRTEQSVAAAETALGPACVGVVADNADEQTPRRLVATAQEKFGRLDGAFVSVGGPPAGPATDITDDQWRAAFESVFLGAARLCRDVAAALGDGGSLVLVLSSSVRTPISGLAMSNGLRPGLGMLAKTMADELGPRGIRVNGMLPGRIDTDRVRELDGMSDDPAAARAASEASIPLRRYGRPEEFGTVGAFLLSPAASFVSGVMLPVDGGMLRAL